MGIDWWWGSLSKHLVFLLFKLQVKQYGFVEVTVEPAETGISQKNTLKSNTKVDRVTHSGILMGICQKSMWISSTKSSAGFVVPFDISMFILRIYNHYLSLCGAPWLSWVIHFSITLWQFNVAMENHHF